MGGRAKRGRHGHRPQGQVQRQRAERARRQRGPGTSLGTAWRGRKQKGNSGQWAVGSAHQRCAGTRCSVHCGAGGCRAMRPCLVGGPGRTTTHLHHQQPPVVRTPPSEEGRPSRMGWGCVVRWLPGKRCMLQWGRPALGQRAQDGDGGRQRQRGEEEWKEGMEGEKER